MGLAERVKQGIRVRGARHHPRPHPARRFATAADRILATPDGRSGGGRHHRGQRNVMVGIQTTNSSYVPFEGDTRRQADKLRPDGDHQKCSPYKSCGHACRMNAPYPKGALPSLISIRPGWEAPAAGRRRPPTLPGAGTARRPFRADVSKACNINCSFADKAPGRPCGGTAGASPAKRSTTRSGRSRRRMPMKSSIYSSRVRKRYRSGCAFRSPPPWGIPGNIWSWWNLTVVRGALMVSVTG